MSAGIDRRNRGGADASEAAESQTMAVMALLPSLGERFPATTSKSETLVVTTSRPDKGILPTVALHMIGALPIVHPALRRKPRIVRRQKTWSSRFSFYRIPMPTIVSLRRVTMRQEIEFFKASPQYHVAILLVKMQLPAASSHRATCHQHAQGSSGCNQRSRISPTSTPVAC